MKLEIGPGKRDSDMLCRNVHTGLRQAHGPAPIVFSWASPVSFTGSGS